ncbi:hypothetical protein HK104_001813 [Borealophlyctis nickersoniae]|nr:hypothetical protein HK104_001813 [Borealophlyctis nickersoniae]
MQSDSLPPPDPLEGEERVVARMQILVCIHGQRDERCGTIGTAVYDQLKEEIKQRGLAGVRVNGVSHIGGHKYAGNVIVWPSGDWYGMVHPENVPELLSALERGEVLWKFWRGRAGLTKEEQIEMYRRATGGSVEQKEGASKNGSQGESITVTYLFSGQSKDVSVPLGKRLMDVGQENHIPTIEGQCGGNLECATCHVILDDEHYNRLQPPSEQELDMIEYAPGRCDT